MAESFVSTPTSEWEGKFFRTSCDEHLQEVGLLKGLLFQISALDHPLKHTPICQGTLKFLLMKPP